MFKLSKEQHKLLAEFFANFAIAWFAGGIITPFITDSPFLKEIILFGSSWGSMFLLVGILLVKET